VGTRVTDGVAGFLNARLDEAQERAEAMGHYFTDESAVYCCPATRTEPLGDLEWGEDACDCALAARKARALREVAARRAILAMYEDQPGCNLEEGVHDGRDPDERLRDEGIRDAMESVVRELAGIDSGHPDYNPAWKP
jgi:hypothetical protein